MADENKAQPFLVIHDKCPVCGNTERLGQQAVDKLKQDKGLPDSFLFQGMVLQIPLIDPAHPPRVLATTFTIKLMVMALDVCANPDCGAVYCTRFDVTDQPAQMAPPPQQQGGFMPNRAQRRQGMN